MALPDLWVAPQRISRPRQPCRPQRLQPAAAALVDQLPSPPEAEQLAAIARELRRAWI